MTIVAKLTTHLDCNIDVDPSSEAMRETLNMPAKRTVEVAVKHAGEVREFTFDEFYRLLGFGG